MRFSSVIAPSKTRGAKFARAAYIAADQPAGPLPMDDFTASAERGKAQALELVA